eukprot:13175457-Heterocapsa_arctica.AAC.1
MVVVKHYPSDLEFDDLVFIEGFGYGVLKRGSVRGDGVVVIVLVVIVVFLGGVVVMGGVGGG